jgi:hypothetical protein
MRSLTKDQMAELELLRQDAGGDLSPDAIVDFARSANTALHRAFTWDDGEAAAKYRIIQAKQVIRAAVTFLPTPSGSLVPVRAYAFDATRSAFTATAVVLEREDTAELLLRQMRADIERVVSRYRRHAELVPKIAAMLDALAPGAQPADGAS